MSRRKTVLIESPYKGDVQKNTMYARACLLDSLRRGEAPFASHLLYTQVIDDADPYYRNMGIEAGLTIGKDMKLTAVYDDLGITSGMLLGIGRAEEERRPVEFRHLGEDWEQKFIDTLPSTLKRRTP